MYVTHVARGQARLWHHTEADLAALAVWTERIVGHGEDADPLVLFQRSAARGILSVSDGAGGAGRALAGRTSDGTAYTQAWVASRRVRALTEEWFATRSSAGSLHEHIVARLVADGAPRSRARGSMQRAFPTTLASIDFRLTRTGVTWDALWAGDSRCYVCEARTGLQQLSRDDAESTDALELLLQDPPMTNLVGAEKPFVLHTAPGFAALPCLLICATDGFFGYLQTPAQFEHMVLDCLMSAQDVRHWSALLAQRVETCTGDDASLAVVALGFEGFGELRAFFQPRAEVVMARHAEPMHEVPPGDSTALVAARERSWRDYRYDYERRLPESWEENK
jgi:serine/threonine protein phosphatase PrpC